MRSQEEPGGARRSQEKPGARAAQCSAAQCRANKAPQFAYFRLSESRSSPHKLLTCLTMASHLTSFTGGSHRGPPHKQRSKPCRAQLFQGTS